MNKKSLINTVRYTYISILSLVLLFTIYEIGFRDDNSVVECFLRGFSFTLMIVIGFFFKKDGVYERKVMKFSDKEIFISILSAFLTMTILLVLIIINTVYYFKLNELSVILTTIQVVILISFKLFLQKRLKKIL